MNNAIKIAHVEIRGEGDLNPSGRRPYRVDFHANDQRGTTASAFLSYIYIYIYIHISVALFPRQGGSHAREEG